MPCAGDLYGRDWAPFESQRRCENRSLVSHGVSTAGAAPWANVPIHGLCHFTTLSPRRQHLRTSSQIMTRQRDAEQHEQGLCRKWEECSVSLVLTVQDTYRCGPEAPGDQTTAESMAVRQGLRLRTLPLQCMFSVAICAFADTGAIFRCCLATAISHHGALGFRPWRRSWT